MKVVSWLRNGQSISQIDAQGEGEKESLSCDCSHAHALNYGGSCGPSTIMEIEATYGQNLTDVVAVVPM